MRDVTFQGAQTLGATVHSLVTKATSHPDMLNPESNGWENCCYGGDRGRPKDNCEWWW